MHCILYGDDLAVLSVRAEQAARKVAVGQVNIHLVRFGAAPVKQRAGPERIGTVGQAIMDMDVGAMMTVIPRISTPTLTAQEMAELDPADLTALSVEVVTFLLKKSVLAGLPTA